MRHPRRLSVVFLIGRARRVQVMSFSAKLNLVSWLVKPQRRFRRFAVSIPCPESSLPRIIQRLEDRTLLHASTMPDQMVDATTTSETDANSAATHQHSATGIDVPQGATAPSLTLTAVPDSISGVNLHVWIQI